MPDTTTRTTGDALVAIGEKLVELGNGLHGLKTDMAAMEDRLTGQIVDLEERLTKRMDERFGAVESKLDRIIGHLGANDA